MANNNSITKTYDDFPLWLRIVLQVVLGVVVGGIYRIVRFFETRNIVTLAVGLIITFTGIGNLIAWVVDLVCLILYKKYTFFVD